MKYFLLVFLPVLIACGQGKKKNANVAGATSRAIPALTPAAVHDQFSKRGFKLEKTPAGEQSTWTSTESNEMHEFKVISAVTNDNKVLSVEASVFSMLTMDESTKQFIGDVASVPYKYADPRKAKQWAIDNFEKGGQTTIGDVNFEVVVNSETRRVLKMNAR